MKFFYFRILAFMCCLFTASAIIAQTSVEPSFGGFGFDDGQTITKIIYDKNVNITFKGTVKYDYRGYIKLSKSTEMSFDFSNNVKAVASIEFYTSSSKRKDEIFTSVEPKWDGGLSDPEKGFAYYTGEDTYTPLFLLQWKSIDFVPTSTLKFTTGVALTLYNLKVNYERIYTGIDDPTVCNAHTTPIYYNLQGQPVAHPEHNSVYIKVDASGATKIRY